MALDYPISEPRHRFEVGQIHGSAAQRPPAADALIKRSTWEVEHATVRARADNASAHA